MSYLAEYIPASAILHLQQQDQYFVGSQDILQKPTNIMQTHNIWAERTLNIPAFHWISLILFFYVLILNFKQ